MRFFADTHIHIYPDYNLGEFFNLAAENILRGVKTASCESGDGEECLRMIFLTERYDCHAFRELAVPEFSGAQHGIRMVPAGRQALRVERDGQPPLVVVAGRQVVTEERLEVLALGMDLEIEDGQPIKTVLAQTREAGAIPVIAWAPGKWFFERGKILAGLLDSMKPDAFALGDTTLRPIGYPTPRLMKQGAARGFRVLAGSDPLPFAGQERVAGTYGVTWTGDLDPEDPGKALREAWLSDGPSPFKLIGARDNPIRVALRLKGNAASKPA